MMRFIVLIFWVIKCIYGIELSKHSFSDDFIFGVSTSAYQVEGAWNFDEKGENIWDHYTHKKVQPNGDIACDSYNKFSNDVKALIELGVQQYSFSLSWSRILPNGLSHAINSDAIIYYNKLIDTLIANKIEPIITLYHWDLPQSLQDMGGWTNERIVDYFEAYAGLAFENFGNRVKKWITFNDPNAICRKGYGGVWMAPAINLSGFADYLCGHNILNAHARVYQMYAKLYLDRQQGTIGISVNANWMEPYTNSTEDEHAIKRAMDFHMNWILNPIFGSGNYPEEMSQIIADRSENEGYISSRLPNFTENEVKALLNSSDFLGITFDTALLVSDIPPADKVITNTEADSQVSYMINKEWVKSCSVEVNVVPWAFRKTLNYIKATYKNPKMMITGIGYPDTGEIKDYKRMQFHQLYLNELIEAMFMDNVNVIGYSIWSLMDTFDWYTGYKCKYGLYQVDFKSDSLKRTSKLSAEMYKKIIKSRKLPEKLTDIPNGAEMYGNMKTIWLLFLSVILLNYTYFDA